MRSIAVPLNDHSEALRRDARQRSSSDMREGLSLHQQANSREILSARLYVGSRRM